MIYLSVSWGRKARFMLSTGLHSSEKFTGTEVPDSMAKSRRMRELYNKVEDYIALHSDEPVSRMKAHLKLVVEGKSVETTKLTDYMEEYASNSRTEGTAEVYRRTIKKITAFDPRCTLETVDRRWLDRFVSNLRKQGLAENSISILLRNIRAVFNWCIDNNLTTSYPFRRYHIPHEKTRHRALTIDQLREIAACPCEPFLVKYRDIFMLIFYFLGINIKDLILNAKIENGRLLYRRSKTGKLFDIKIEPEAMAIIEKYKGNDHLLNIADHYKSYRDCGHNLNDNLKKIGKVEIVPDKVGKMRKLKRTPIEPRLSTYWARHTWATIAASLDIPKDTIAAALGHSGDTVTDIYIEFDHRKVDEANRRVIDYVLYNKR